MTNNGQTATELVLINVLVRSIFKH